MPPSDQETKKLSAAAAQALFIKNYPLKYNVTAKFDDDHITAAPNLSKSTSIADALERYKRNQKIKLSSWILISKDTLKNKAAGGRKIATIYNGTQQMAVEIKVTRRTVTLEPLEYKERQRYDHEVVKIGKEEHYLSCSSQEKEVKLCVLGKWQPLEGDIDLYHYEESAFPGTAAMLAKYLEWNCEGSEILSPTAKS